MRWFMMPSVGGCSGKFYERWQLFVYRLERGLFVDDSFLVQDLLLTP